MKQIKSGNILACNIHLLRKKKRITKKKANNRTFIPVVFHAKYGCVEYNAIKDAIIKLTLDRYDFIDIHCYNLASTISRFNTPLTSYITPFGFFKNSRISTSKKALCATAKIIVSNFFLKIAMLSL